MGTQGLRALAHTRVDERAGLPKGSTSNYFRTDQALLSGIVDTLEELDTLAAGAAFRLTSGVTAPMKEGLARVCLKRPVRTFGCGAAWARETLADRRHLHGPQEARDRGGRGARRPLPALIGSALGPLSPGPPETDSCAGLSSAGRPAAPARPRRLPGGIARAGPLGSRLDRRRCTASDTGCGPGCLTFPRHR